MKAIILISICLNILYGMALAQCGNGGLKIQSDACEAPKNLKISSIDCSQMSMTWSGVKDRMYILKATLTDPSMAQPEIKAFQVNADKNGNCKAAIQVKQGMHISWTVQAICTNGQSNMYSPEIIAEQVLIPFCTDGSDASSKAITVYPNPTKDYLMIEYQGSGEDFTKFDILNIAGKVMLTKTFAATKKKSSYKLDITSLLPGTYLIKSFSEKDGTNQSKFIKLSN